MYYKFDSRMDRQLLDSISRTVDSSTLTYDCRIPTPIRHHSTVNDEPSNNRQLYVDHSTVILPTVERELSIVRQSNVNCRRLDSRMRTVECPTVK